MFLREVLIYIFFPFYQALEIVYQAWQVTIFLLVNLVVCVVVRKPFTKNSQGEISKTLLGFLFPIAISLSGSLLIHHGIGYFFAGPIIAYFAIVALFALHLSFLGFLFAKAKNIRWFVVSIALIQVWLSILTLLFSYLSISGADL